MDAGSLMGEPGGSVDAARDLEFEQQRGDCIEIQEAELSRSSLQDSEEGVVIEKDAGCSNRLMNMDYDYESDSVSVADSVSQNLDLYSLEIINVFLDETFGQKIDVRDYFSHVEKHSSATTLQNVVGLNIQDGKNNIA